MQNKITTIAGGLLGLLFILFGLDFFFGFMPKPPMPEEGSPAAMFFGAIYVSGFLAFVKVFEIIGGILVAVPKTRNFGLLVLGPIVINILAINTFISPGGLLQPPVIAIAMLSAFLLWSGRESFAKLLN